MRNLFHNVAPTGPILLHQQPYWKLLNTCKTGEYFIHTGSFSNCFIRVSSLGAWLWAHLNVFWLNAKRRVFLSEPDNLPDLHKRAQPTHRSFMNDQLSSLFRMEHRSQLIIQFLLCLTLRNAHLHGDALPFFSSHRQILIEFCAGGAVDAVMLGESAFPLCTAVITSTRNPFRWLHKPAERK